MAGEILRENLLLGIGQPILDITAQVDENFLTKYDLKENTATVSNLKHENLFNELKNFKPIYLPGGSVYNSLSIIQSMIKKSKIVTFLGCVGKDEYSKILITEGVKNGLNLKFEELSDQSTSSCAVLITNQHRTLCTKIGAANFFSIEHMKNNWDTVENAKFYYIAGFFLLVNPQVVMEVAKHSHENNKCFIMNLSAEFICLKFKEEFMEVFPYVDVIFGNESEAITFAETNNFSTTDIHEISKKLSKLPKLNEKKRLVIITRNEKPIILVKDEKIQEFPIKNIPKSSIVNTNGAGDAFVGGFLSQYIQKKDIKDCIKHGIWASSEIIQKPGCTLNN